MNDELMLEILDNSIDETIGECHLACTDAIDAITEALEIYEIECIESVRTRLGVVEEDFQPPGAIPKKDDEKEKSTDNNSNKDNGNTASQKASKGFFSKIAEILKKAAAKIAEIGKKIFNKLSEKAKLLANKIRNLTTSKFLGGKPWPNGFDIDLVAGSKANYKLFEACKRVGKEMENDFIDLGESILSGDRNRMMERAKKNEAFIKGLYNSPIELINEVIEGTKFEKGEDALHKWTLEVFKFDQKDENFRMDIAFQRKMINQLLDMRLENTANQFANSNNIERMKSLRKNADKMEEIANKVEHKTIYPTIAPVLRQLASMMIKTAEFGLVAPGQVINFSITKHNEILNKFAELGIIRVKKK